MPRKVDVEKLRRENRALRAENRRLKRESAELHERMTALGVRVEAMQERQTAIAESAGKTEELMRWLRARVRILEREMGGGSGGLRPRV